MADKEEGAKKKKSTHSPRNYLLPGGVWRYGRSAMYKRRRNYLKKNLNKEKAVKKRVHFKIKPIGGANNGGTRMVLTRKSVRSPCAVPLSHLSPTRGNGTLRKKPPEDSVGDLLPNPASYARPLPPGQFSYC